MGMLFTKWFYLLYAQYTGPIVISIHFAIFDLCNVWQNSCSFDHWWKLKFSAFRIYLHKYYFSVSSYLHTKLTRTFSQYSLEICQWLGMTIRIITRFLNKDRRFVICCYVYKAYYVIKNFLHMIMQSGEMGFRGWWPLKRRVPFQDVLWEPGCPSILICSPPMHTVARPAGVCHFACCTPHAM